MPPLGSPAGARHTSARSCSEGQSRSRLRNGRDLVPHARRERRAEHFGACFLREAGHSAARTTGLSNAARTRSCEPDDDASPADHLGSGPSLVVLILCMASALGAVTYFAVRDQQQPQQNLVAG